jgi:hypothetical protein
MLKTSSIIIEGSCIGRDITIPFWPELDLGVNCQSYFQDEIELAHPSHVRPFFLNDVRPFLVVIDMAQHPRLIALPCLVMRHTLGMGEGDIFIHT